MGAMAADEGTRLTAEGLALADEAPVLRVRPHWVGLAGGALVPATVVAAVALLASDVLRAQLALFALAIAVCWTAAVWIAWAARSLTLTRRNLIIASGVLVRVSQVIPIEGIHEVTCRQTLIGRALGYGVLEFSLTGSSGHRLFGPAPRPHRLRVCILRAKTVRPP